MTKAQIQRIKDQLNKKWQAGEIHADDYFDTAALLDKNPEAGLEEAERILGKQLVKKPAGKTRGMSHDEYVDLVSQVQQLRDDDEIDHDGMLEMLAELERLNNGAAKRDTAEAVLSAMAQGIPAEFAEKNAGYEPAKQTRKAPEKKPRKDTGEKATDAATLQIENNLKTIYADAAKELRDRLGKLEREYAGKLEKKRQELRDGKITEEEYASWVRGQMMNQERVKQQIDQCTGTIYNANKKALGMVNGERLGVFAENANFQSYELDRSIGQNLMFTLYDETTAEKLLRDKPNLLPPKKVNERKDRAWNYGRITDAVTQAVIQGDSIPHLARRIAGDAAGSNASTMMRYARTAMTAAQNAGRMEVLHQAKGLGIKCKKRWLATLDGRTRDSHRNLDGQVVDIDKPFKSDLGEIMFPGDPSANPGDVWNCRCTMVYEYEDYAEPADAALRRDNVTGEMIPDMTYNEWKQMNTPADKQPSAKQTGKSTLQKKAEKAAKKHNPLDDLSAETVDLLEQYGAGEEFHLNQAQFDEVTDAMEKTTTTLYRVESADRTAEQEDLQVGDIFDFSQYMFEAHDAEQGPLRSFTFSADALPDLVDQLEVANGTVIYRTNGAVNQLPIDSIAVFDQKETLAYANGWKVTGMDTMEVNGKQYRVIDIEQIKNEPEKKPAEDYDAIMKKVAAMEDDKGTWEEGKKNLLPLADERLSDQAHRIFSSMTPEEENRLARETILDISKLKTEQKEVFTDRLEDLAEAFNGKEITGAKTAEHDGITVARWNGEYIVLDGNNRTNLAILKGQEKLNVMLLDFDDNPDLQDKIRDVVARTPVDGKNITASWKRRPDDFAFEIEDVINAQGFDGLPRIADAAEFNAAVKASGFIAQRVYSAPDQETLDLYQDMLYNGKWYVDCGTGGAHFGQGMYCTGADGEKLTQEIKDTMNYYSTANEALLARRGQESKSEMAQRNRQYIERNYSITPEHMETVEKLVYGRLDGTLPKQEDIMLYKSLTGEEKRQLAKITEDMKISGRNQPRMVKRNEPVSTIETITLTPNARTISWSALEKEYNEDGMQRHKDMDIGAYAAMKGYDAVTHIPNTLEGNPEIDVLILNRTKVIIKGGGKK